MKGSKVLSICLLTALFLPAATLGPLPLQEDGAGSAVAAPKIPGSRWLPGGGFHAFPKPMISTRFSHEERQLLWAAVNIARDRLNNDAVLQCTQKYTHKDVSGNANEALAEVRTFELGRRALYIVRYDSPERNGLLPLGEAFIGNPGVKGIRIAINARALRARSPEVIAGTIIHEVLHQLGYNHEIMKSREDFDRLAPGNFVYESGWCITRNGADKDPNGGHTLTGSGGQDVWFEEHRDIQD